MANIRGQITDITTGKSLPFAYIEIEASNNATNTDLNGMYNLRVIPGTYNLIARYIGYEPKKIQNVIVSADRSLNITLTPIATELKPLTVEAKRTYFGAIITGITLGIIYLLNKLNK
jgi:hypothetical protein